MARKFATSIDLMQNQLLNAVVQTATTAPATYTPTAGQLWMDTTSGTDAILKFYNGTAWVSLSRLDKITAPTASVSLNSQKITNLLDPTLAQDAATKNYVDLAVAGLNYHPAVQVMVSVNITIATPGSTFDSYTCVTNDRILLTGQTTQSENGIWVWNGASSTLTRPVDFNIWSEVVNAFTFVTNGTQYADTGWVSTSAKTGTLGTTAITFVQFSSANMINTASVGVASGTQSIIATPVGNTRNFKGIAPGTYTTVASNTTDITIDVNASALATYMKTTGGFTKLFTVGSTAGATTTVTHNLNNSSAEIQVYEVSTGNGVECDVSSRAANSLVVTFNPVATLNQYTIVAIG